MAARTFAGLAALALGVTSRDAGSLQSQPPPRVRCRGNTSLVSAGIVPRSNWTDVVDRAATSRAASQRRWRSWCGWRRGGASAPAVGETPAAGVPLCGNRLGRSRQSPQKCNGNKRWGYVHIPGCLPALAASAVALDSKGNLWVFRRADAGKPQLFKFDSTTLILQVGQDVTGYQDKAHGMAVDAEDNV